MLYRLVSWKPLLRGREFDDGKRTYSSFPASLSLDITVHFYSRNFYEPFPVVQKTPRAIIFTKRYLNSHGSLNSPSWLGPPRMTSVHRWSSSTVHLQTLRLRQSLMASSLPRVLAASIRTAAPLFTFFLPGGRFFSVVAVHAVVFLITRANSGTNGDFHPRKCSPDGIEPV